ncbi:glycosyl hydrolase family 18 protein [Sulfobacillus thermosulfidooxidans]|uniref:glycosyl hydrolase family 18 protein n=1 Tax=Sulfobacillus thermosulfidooxidans TaxID=28034 RepID=UPI00096BBFBD|nr:glycosyl hydrolase family 18 protein [Sulfobacillus thermosulfidooxidans]OLZ09167.1 glycoside hydrolase [Sulfobacillus thermosulfidooxidans]OLZ17732.1 glycoside hydrolase [Sulfobacillus thermosulfidooxidans]OLZ22277.1 glycoside hydrolase [Sulfobacillus thermosulfidooxidans]
MTRDKGIRHAYNQRPLFVVTAIFLVIALVGGLIYGQNSRVIASWDRALLHPAEASIAVPTTGPRPEKTAQNPGPSDGLPPGMVLGYFYDPGNQGNAAAMLQHYLPFLTGIIPFWYTINANGYISGQTNPAVLQIARQHHLWTFALIENMAGQSVFGPLLSNPVASQRAIENMLTLVEDNGYDGVNLDWEGMAPSEQEAFTQFVSHLSQVFHRHGYYVTLSLPAETSYQPTNSWTGAYNYPALAKSADLLMIMAYDEHWAGGSPGPIASPSWVKAVLNYTISVVPPSKVILGIPGYGYDWSNSGAIALSYGQAQSLEQQYTHETGKNHFVYVQNGAVHSVWFEDTQSLLSKIQLVSGYELRGIALWRLGIEDPKIWDFLQ